MRPDGPEDHDPDREGPSRNATLAAVVLLVLLGLAGYWLATVLRQQGRIEDCVLARRANCNALVE
jgi:hypothetical protein